MVVEFTDSVAGTKVYIIPHYVVSLRPDPNDPTRVTEVKLQDGQTIHVFGEHSEVADKLMHATPV